MWLEALANRAEKAPVAHLATLSAKLKVARPLMVTLWPSFTRAAVCALNAVFAPISVRLQAQLLDFGIINTCGIETTKT